MAQSLLDASTAIMMDEASIFKRGNKKMMEIKWTSNQSFDKEKRDATMQAMLERKWTFIAMFLYKKKGEG